MDLYPMFKQRLFMAKNEAIVVGWIRKGKPADCGETMKNQLMIQKLEELGVHCRQIDFKDWKKHPWVFLKLAWNMIFHRDNTLILSTSTVNVYPMIKLMAKLKWKQHSIHWVIGGNLGTQVMNSMYAADIIDYIDLTIVESPLMVKQLTECNVKKVIQLPNFKPIPYYPNIQAKLERQDTNTGRKLRFVFLSRIMGEKGCDYILEAARQMNEEGFCDKYEIDFYGKIAHVFVPIFTNKVNQLPNVQYKGFLNLQTEKGYDQLAEYDAMLFPTYWSGEGFAGVFMDAFICGLPMIATDWAHNSQFMKNGETAILIPVHNIEALKNGMKDCINGKIDLATMSKNCQNHAQMYEINNVITKEFVKEIGLWQE